MLFYVGGVQAGVGVGFWCRFCVVEKFFFFSVRKRFLGVGVAVVWTLVRAAALLLFAATMLVVYRGLLFYLYLR